MKFVKILFKYWLTQLYKTQLITLIKLKNKNSNNFNNC